MGDRCTNSPTKVLLFLVLLSKYCSGCPIECNCGHLKVDCSNRDLEKIPPFTRDLQRSIYVDLRTNSIQHLTKASFPHLTSVQTLILQFNMLTFIEEGTFSNMSALKTLDLSGNQFKVLPRAIFKPLRNLHSLDLSQNYLTNLDGVLSSLTNLYRLDLGHNNLPALTDMTFTDLQGLMYLMLGNNRISRISKNAFSPLTKLSYLVLKNNPLYNVDHKFINNRRMSYADLTNCRLQSIPKDLPWVMRYLQLTQNNITSITKDSLVAYNYVAVVVLDQNKIHTVEPAAFLHMTYLRQLWMNGNKLTSVPEELPLGLHFLYLDSNEITHLHENIFVNRSKLQTFSVKGNNLQHISPKHFDKMLNVTKLYLDNNNLTEIEDFTFKSLGKLQKLFISRNPLKKLNRYSFFGLRQLYFLEMAFVTTTVDIDEMMFSKTPRLATLELQYSNSLASRICNSETVLKTLSNLTDLNLMSAELSTLTPLLQDALPNLEKLELADNKFHCDQALLWLNHWMRLAKTLFVNKMDVKCFSPRNLQGKVISSLFDSQFVPVTTTTTTTTAPSSSQFYTYPQLSPLTTSQPSTKTSPPTRTTTQYQPKLTTTAQTRETTTTPQPTTTTVSTTKSRKPKSTTPLTTAKRQVTTTTTKAVLTRRWTKPSQTTGKPRTTQLKHSSLITNRGFTVKTTTNAARDKGAVTNKAEKPVTREKTLQATNGTNSHSPSSGLTTIVGTKLESTSVVPLSENSSSPALKESENFTEDNSGKVTAIATSVSVILLLIILIVIGCLVFRYRRNRLIYHRAIHYQQHSDMMYFITVSDSETKPIKGPNRSERGSVSSMTSQDITNEEGGIKVYHWDGEQ